jgi:two-component system, NarL family, nitrate/nitrite response regulator NarL
VIKTNPTDAAVSVIDRDLPPIAARPMTDKNISVLISAPMRLYRDGLAAILARQEGIEVAGIAGDRGDTLVRWLELAPDVVLVDLALEGSVATIRRLAERNGRAGAGVAVLVSSDTEDELIACARAGVFHFVTREDSIADLALTLRSAALGESRIPPETAAAVLGRLADGALGRVSAPEGPRLTPRETEVMELIEQGLSNKEIARRLSVAVSTVKQHVHHILEKLEVSRRGEAVARLQRSRV